MGKTSTAKRINSAGYKQAATGVTQVLGWVRKHNTEPYQGMAKGIISLDNTKVFHVLVNMYRANKICADNYWVLTFGNNQ